MTELDPRNSASPADSAPDEGLSPRAAAEAKKAAAAKAAAYHPADDGPSHVAGADKADFHSVFLPVSRYIDSTSIPVICQQKGKTKDGCRAGGGCCAQYTARAHRRGKGDDRREAGKEAGRRPCYGRRPGSATAKKLAGRVGGFSPWIRPALFGGSCGASTGRRRRLPTMSCCLTAVSIAAGNRHSRKVFASPLSFDF